MRSVIAVLYLEEADSLPQLLSHGLVLDVIEVELGVGKKGVVLLRGESVVSCCQGWIGQGRSNRHPEGEKPHLGPLSAR